MVHNSYQPIYRNYRTTNDHLTPNDHPTTKDHTNTNDHSTAYYHPTDDDDPSKNIYPKIQPNPPFIHVCKL